ncbi:Bacterial type II secretion system domain protein F [uncultured Eubacteriales bacterium]|uniref:Bacterial type II secretion system domain protein F n=1 Tax=uncultured Eubacteriales bacterium TaxID=172733 RepID=A0A212IUJ8_9FIRM|nr:Bacterial type II secretion system domain protein F [uncultured Eubacteriales bacterium]
MKEQAKAASAPTNDELSVFCSQLALMLQAGIGFEEGVELLEKDAGTPRVKALLGQIGARLSQGIPLSAALAETGAFPAYLLRMVEIGQAAGRLEQVLFALGTYYQREADTGRSLRRMVAYPAVMAILIAVVFLVLVARVLPVFQQVFAQLGMSLDPAAQALLQVGSAGKYVAGVLAVTLALGAVALLYLFWGEGGSASFTRLFSRTDAAKALDRSRFASAMALMLSSGLPLDESMSRTCQLLEGSALSPVLEDCRAKMDRGIDFPRAVEGIFPPLQIGLLSAGFRAGVSDQTMETLSRRCQTEADEALARLLSRFEYGLVIALCAAVGLVLLAVMLPLLGVLSAIGG